MSKDYYNILGISPEASEEEVRIAFERLSSKLDTNYRGDELLADIEEAYVVLSDPQSRAEYNRLYKIFGGLAKGFDGLDTSWAGRKGWPKGLTFSSGLATTLHGLEEGMDLELDLDELDSPALSELVNALKSTIFNLINNQNESPHLKNSSGRGLQNPNVYLDMELNTTEAGYKFLDYYCYIQCSDCNGRGSWRGHPLIDCLACLNLKRKEHCMVCAGLGKYPKENCPKCKGEGRVMAKRQVEVKIPKNLQNQAIIQVAGAGHRGFRGLKNGDLFVKVILTDQKKR